MKKLFLFATVVALISTTGCKKDTTTNPVACGNGTITCTINGAAYTTASTTESTLLKSTYAGTPVKRLDIRAKATDGKYIVLTVTNLENAGSGDGVMVKDYFANVLQNYSNAAGYEGALATYTQGTTTTIAQSRMTGTTGKISITSCDATGHTVAGNFTMELDDYTGAGGTYTVVGTFANVCYTVK